MSSQEYEDVPKLSVSLVVLGDSGVGKTCLIHRFIKGAFDNGYKPSTGQSYASKTIEMPEIGKSIEINVIDTAGQERYRSLTRIFYQGAKMVILVYDITNKNSFDNIKDWWYKDVKEHGDKNVIIGIAGNKSDEYDKEAVSEQEARDFAKSIGAVFSLTSAQNNSGIYKLFENIGRKYLQLIYPNIESDMQKKNQKEESNQKIKIGEKDADKKKEKQKNKKKHCIK